MSSHSEDREDMLEKMERIAEEAGMHEEDDDSFDAEAIFMGKESFGPEASSITMSANTSSYHTRAGESEGSAMFYEDDEEWNAPEDSQGEGDAMQAQRRGSSRRSSFVSTDSAATSHSSRDDSFPPRPGSPGFEPTRSGRQQRRHSVNLTSIYASNKRSSSSGDGLSDLPPPRIMRTIRQPFSRISTLRPAYRRRSHDSNSSPLPPPPDSTPTFMSLDQIGRGDMDNVAAAAAVVALGSAASAGSKRIQYAVDDIVLVFLNILNHTNSVDPPEAFTVFPVNKYGFPAGEGKTQEEQQGPFVYVMATVKRVHFNEDVPYYTVIREDTLAEQRADVAWMEPLTSMHGIEAATRAAHQTGQSAHEHEPSSKETGGIGTALLAVVGWPVRFSRSTLVPWYRTARAFAKEQVKHILYGEAPFYCRFRMTGINLLVICSVIYMFIEVVSLAYFPANWDYAVAVIGVVVWSILVLELLFEWLIRPANYNQLKMSDKAFAPSTARHINNFHLIFETIALLLFVPEFDCLATKECGTRLPLSGVNSALSAVTGPTNARAALGRFLIGLQSLRMFGLVRHWKTMWINRTFLDERGKPMPFFRKQNEYDDGEYCSVRRVSRKSKTVVEEDDNRAVTINSHESEEDQRLRKAATIGTALMVVNSHRALILIVTIVTVMPMFLSLLGVNTVAAEMVDILQANNLMLSEANGTSCAFLQDTINTWLDVGAVVQTRHRQHEETTFVLWAQLLPVRCDFQGSDGVITRCDRADFVNTRTCEVWRNITPDDPRDATPEYYAQALNIRVGGVTEYKQAVNGTLIIDLEGNSSILPNEMFSVRALMNENHAVRFVYSAEFLLLFCMLALTLFGLAVLRMDAGRLVLGPLQRMLKIVVRYAENPLSPTPQGRKRKQKKGHTENGDDNSVSDTDKESNNVELGNYETEQLINAIAKIADLLRKCWGVAGAGIISTNLARTEDGMTVVFNPTVPGKQVYALFAFVAIDHFSDQLLALDRDVMILINDVAKVVHDEVYRWSLGDSGQCNKNLGSAFLMVFRIGDFTEVQEKKARATDVVFSTSDKKRSKTKTLRRRGRAVAPHVTGRGRLSRRRSVRGHLDAGESLTLASLPGISAFTDRALIGLLKSFAGIYRDKNIQEWKQDFRLGGGVGAFSVDIMIGMDAGWAVEGAVGSEYKIDATYLSPHVNMASRMMSASKQYGVTLLLSQAVEELLSRPARAKLRHLDTVYVKGSSVAQRVFTYDARHQGVDFFLFERSPEQADMDAESYSPTIWDTDQDLRAMRQHVTQEFQEKFQDGVAKYLTGNWKASIAALQEADDIMITTVLEEGYIDYNPDEEIDGRIFDRRNTDDEVMRLRQDYGDGACKCLINYMERRKATPPKKWNGVRPLTSK